MNRGQSHEFLLAALFVAVLPTTAGSFSPGSAAAEDQLLPLKVKVGDKVPDFTLPSADGKSVKLSDYAGHSVLIDFYRGYW
jgi:cytochrome oxidase Cu insertion factor (SCO1/SenC/PrrC family)